MGRSAAYDAVVVGSGPNGLAAAVALAGEGCRVLVLEAAGEAGGGLRTLELTLPGYRHDHCSAIHPLGVASPFFRTLPLAEHGLEWVHPELPLAHPLEGRDAVWLAEDPAAMGACLGRDAGAWERRFGTLARLWPRYESTILGPPRFPRHPLAAARFGLPALRSASGLARSWFREPPARALFAGLAAHSLRPLRAMATAGFGLVLGVLGHRVGWPFPRGGAVSLARALVRLLEDRGGEVRLDQPVGSLEDLPPARAVVFDLTPRQVLAIAGHRLPRGVRRALEGYRYGWGVFKMDWALSDPIPWSSPDCRRAGTVHVGGTLEEIEASEAEVSKGRLSERPFVLVAQHTVFDAGRAPEGGHTGWAYCHVPNGWRGDLSEVVESQIERHAPGFRETILGRSALDCPAMESFNANLVGGDINGGVQDLRQILARPRLAWNPYRLGEPGLYIASASTPPGGGVHGMAGFHAAQSLLRGELRRGGGDVS